MLSNIQRVVATIMGMGAMSSGALARSFNTPSGRRAQYPFSSTRQHERHARRQYMVTNGATGFTVMNTRKARHVVP